MAIAFDAVSSGATETFGVEGSPYDWTHTPVGTPRAIVVHLQLNNGTAGPTAVTYGGVAMTQMTGSPVLKTTGEAIGVSSWFLGSSIPTGAQTVAATYANGQITGNAISYTASADCLIVDVDATISSDSLANPSVTLSLGGFSCACSISFSSGQNATTGITPLTNWTSRRETAVSNKSYGCYTYDIVGTTDVTAGWTQTADDAVMIAVAVRESASLSIVAGGGSYAVSGTAATLKHGWKIAAAGGSYALSGTDAAHRFGKIITAGGGSYAVSGAAASILHKWKVLGVGAPTFDAIADSSANGSQSPKSWTHTPVGVPRAIVVYIVMEATSLDVTGVTYGGVAMTQVSGSPNSKATGEPGEVFAWFLGSGIPTGPQTVTATWTGTSSAVDIHLRSMSYAASTDCSVVATNVSINSDSAANPSSTLALSGTPSAVSIGIFSGWPEDSGIAPLTNWTARQERLFSDGQVSGVYTYDIFDSADVTVGWAQAANDAVAIAVAFTTGGAAYVVSGTAASPLHKRRVTAGNSSYALSGTNASLFHGWELTAGGGSYAMSGTDASLIQLRRVIAADGGYSIRGADATLVSSQIWDTVAGGPGVSWSPETAAGGTWSPATQQTPGWTAVEDEDTTWSPVSGASNPWTRIN